MNMAGSRVQSADPVHERHSVRRIQKIARHTGARNYLEIGVQRGLTFHNISLERKVAVDPKFRFDVAEYQQRGVEFYAMPSDRYFTLHGASQKFDIIFLDGLHTFQQTFRDFCNSLGCAHDRTVWLIDDVLPVDVYSAWPNQQEAIRFRSRAGGNDIKAWHGDVFKIVFAIHDFFPMFTYVTLVGTGNPQLLVWKTPRIEFRPIFDSMEAIERLTYFHLLQRESVLNTMPDHEAFETFFASVPGAPEVNDQ